MATTSQWWSGQQASLVNSAVRYMAISGNGNAVVTNEVDTASVVASAGTARGLAVRLSAAPGAGTSYRFQLSINGVASTQIDVTISEGATVGTVSASAEIAAGDLVTIKVTPTGTPGVVDAEYWTEFDPTTANAYCYPAGLGNGLLSSAAQYAPLFGNHAQLSSSAFITRTIAPYAGTITALYMSIGTAPGAGASWDFCITRNGLEEASSVINIAEAGKTGNVTGLSIAVAAGDYLEFKVKAENGLATSTRGVSCCAIFVPTIAGLFCLYGNTNTTPGEAAVAYGVLGARRNIGYNATETVVSVRAPAPLRVRAMAALLTTAPTGAGKSRTFTFRSDPGGGGSPASGTNTFTITNTATSGSDTAHSDIVAAGDLIDLMHTPANTPAVSSGLAWAIGAMTNTSLGGGGSTGGKGKGGGKGGGTGSPPVPPGKLKAFGVGRWNLGNRRWF